MVRGCTENGYGGRAAEAVLEIYREYGLWLEERENYFACVPGCHTCCTVSVTATAVEAGIAAEFIGVKRLRRLMEGVRLPAADGLESANAIAAACLEGRWEDHCPEHDFSPCPFLGQGRCSIYPVRPFGCRAFFSRVPCGKAGAAEVEPWFVSLNLMVQQVIEHLSRGRGWGRFVDLMREEAGVGGGPSCRCAVMPAVMVPPWELVILRPYAERIMAVVAFDPELTAVLHSAFRQR